MLTLRLSYTIHHHILQKQEFKTLPQKLVQVIESVEAQVEKYQPCAATGSFDNHKVRCDVSKKFHHLVHQSSKSYRTYRVGRLGWLGIHTQTLLACRWGGTFLNGNETVPQMVDIVTKAVLQGECVNFEQSLVLFAPWATEAIYHSPSVSVCLGCLLQLPRERLECNHLLCSLCCKARASNCTVKCPFCARESHWGATNPPEGAGYRILSLDSGGIRGVVTALLLKQVEENVGIQIKDLFDLVVGTGSGGLIALSIGEHNRTGGLMTIFQQISQTAFIPVSKLGMNFAQFFYKHKYQPTLLHKKLSDHFSHARIDSLRVAVVGHSPFTNAAILFSSYLTANSVCNQQQQRTVFDVAKIFGSGTLYPILNEPICAIDGSVVCSNPSTVALEEARAIWPEKSLDILVSVGIGKWSEEDKRLENDMVPFGWSCVSAAALAEADWAQLCKGFRPTSDEVVRLDATLGKEYAMDDGNSFLQIVDATTSFIVKEKAIIDAICNKILAKLFYISSTSQVFDENGFCVCIQTRVHVPQLSTDLRNCFSAETLIGGRSTSLDCTCSWNENSKIKLSAATVQFPLQDFSLIVYSHLGYDGNRITPGVAISGCPFIFKI
eukprot:Phypoly_transcript_04779.p1 GENE.Phypoly_transcript_04779~~Phypoly_transcript_04779.p1  ORF type:complete len:608 (+),score=41.66 Phypoly_transcript_04779:124-1947(+)